MKLEQIVPNAAIQGIPPDGLVSAMGVPGFGSSAVELAYQDPSRRVANQLLYAHVSEANWIWLAHLFDPVLEVHTTMFGEEQP